MKGFIEVTRVGGNTKTLLQTNLITYVDEASDSKYRHTYTLITYTDAEQIHVQESYEQIKELIKQA